MTGAPPVSGKMTDEELVAAFARGSEEAFTILVGKYKDPLVNFTMRLLGNREEALDVVQETFVRLYRKGHTYRPVAKFSTWLYTIAGNLARSELRRRKWGIPARRAGAGSGEDHAPPEAVDPGELPDAAAGRALDTERIERALRALPDSFREAVVLFYIEDMSYDDICRILGIRMGTLKSRLNRARGMLEASLRPILDRDAHA
jgi:RNA polymerase sigma-70 factor (ECF subfamily)